MELATASPWKRWLGRIRFLNSRARIDKISLSLAVNLCATDWASYFRSPFP
jgi:hypothetical protein